MKNYKILFAIQLVLLGVVAAWFYTGKEKNAYVEIATVYGDFELKKELSAQFDQVQQTRKYVLDSLKLNLDASYKEIQTTKDKKLQQAFELQRQQFLYKQQQFEEDNQRLLQQYEEQIWTQLNQYIKEFGAYYSYDYIYGANGNGSVMYANDANNVSEQLLNYVNEKYHGKVQ